LEVERGGSAVECARIVNPSTLRAKTDGIIGTERDCYPRGLPLACLVPGSRFSLLDVRPSGWTVFRWNAIRGCRARFGGRRTKPIYVPNRGLDHESVRWCAQWTVAAPSWRCTSVSPARSMP